MTQRRLRLLRRWITGAQGESPPEMRVLCPVEGEAIDVDRCIHCPRWAGLYIEPSRRLSYVTCAVDGPPPDGETLGDIMTPNVACVRPDLPCDVLTGLLIAGGFSGVPVVDEKGHAIGVVSQTDLLRETAGGKEPGRLEATAGKVMSPFVLGLPASAPISQAAALMAFEGVHRVVVTGPHGDVVGVVSTLDILRWLARREGYLSVEHELPAGPPGG